MLAESQVRFSGLPSAHLPSYSFGPIRERALNKTEATLPPIYSIGTLHLTGPQAHG